MSSIASRDIAAHFFPMLYDGDEDNEEHYPSEDSNDEDDMSEDEYDSDEHYNMGNVRIENPKPPTLQQNIQTFLKVSSCENAILEESPTLRLIKALHEKKLEKVILAIDQGAQTDLKDFNLLEHIGTMDTNADIITNRHNYGWNDGDLEELHIAMRQQDIARRRRSSKNEDNSNIIEIYRFLMSKYPNLITLKAAKNIIQFDDASLTEDMLSRLKFDRPGVLQMLYQEILGVKGNHLNHETTIPALKSVYVKAAYPTLQKSTKENYVRSYISGKRLDIRKHHKEILNTIQLFHKLCGFNFGSHMAERDGSEPSSAKTSWHHLCKEFILPWFDQNFDARVMFGHAHYMDPDLARGPDESIGNSYLEYISKTGSSDVPNSFPRTQYYYRTTLITDFMEDLFSRRLISYRQFSTEPIVPLLGPRGKKRDIIGNEVKNGTDDSLSLMDAILGNDKSVPLNIHNKHKMVQLIVSNFTKFLAEFSSYQLIQSAFLLYSQKDKLSSSLGLYLLKGGNPEIGNHMRVIAELKDIIKTGVKGMKTIRRINALNLPEDESDDGDLLAGLNRHLKRREEKLKKMKPQNTDFLPGAKTFLNAEFGLTPKVNNALIIELVMRWKDQSRK